MDKKKSVGEDAHATAGGTPALHFYAFTTLPLRRQEVQTRTRLEVPAALARTGRKLMFQRRLVMLWAWLTLLPLRGFLPQTEHTCAMTSSESFCIEGFRTGRAKH
jgi:hypothetical protein